MNALNAAALATASLLVASCNTVPSYAPHPLLTPNGSIGFSVSGVASYTNDRVAAEAQVRKVLEEACGGQIKLVSLSFQEANSLAGVPHLAYVASAECR